MRLTGMRGFFVIWAGQLLSRIGSHLTSFALAIWAFDQTGLATSLTLIGFCAWGANIIASPFAGTLVDRWDRKLTMLISDLTAVLATLTVLALYTTGHLQIWHLYLNAVVVGIGDSFQWPAYSAAITTMLKKEHYARASGFNSMTDWAPIIVGPPLAALLMALIPVSAIMLIDVATFLAAIGAVLAVTVPQPPVTEIGRQSRSGSFWSQLSFGWRYIVTTPSLIGLQIVILSYNAFNSMGSRLTAPMVLARTDGSAAALSVVEMAAGVGGVLSGLLVGAWGGFKNRPAGLFLGIFGQCTGYALMGLGRTVPVWTIALLLSSFSVAVALASNQSYWQSKVPPDIQGKVFATRRMIAQMVGPLGVLISGPLADRLFEPAMSTGGTLSGSLAWLVGTGPGSGMGLQMVIFGLLGAFAGLSGFLFRATRDAERMLPDHNLGGKAEAETALEESVPAEPAPAPAPAG